jgi:uncharacterized protein YmfQ (DUF2313 family)
MRALLSETQRRASAVPRRKKPKTDQELIAEFERKVGVSRYRRGSKTMSKAEMKRAVRGEVVNELDPSTPIYFYREENGKRLYKEFKK